MSAVLPLDIVWPVWEVATSRALVVVTCGLVAAAAVLYPAWRAFRDGPS